MTLIKSTAEFTYQKPNYVAPFDSIETQLRRPEDKFHPLSPKERFDDLESKEPNARVYGLPILPQPALVRLSPTEQQIDTSGNPVFGVPIHQNGWNMEFEKTCNHDAKLITDYQVDINEGIIGDRGHRTSNIRVRMFDDVRYFLNIEMFDVRMFANIQMFESSNVRMFANI